MRLFAAGRCLVLVARWCLPVALAGCSTTYQVGALFGGEDAERTGAISSVPATAQAVPDGDLAFAKAAATELLAQGGKDASLPWENPGTGARGTVTPLASSFEQGDGTLCREFLASHVRHKKEAWYQGQACRRGKHWEVREIRPLQRT